MAAYSLRDFIDARLGPSEGVYNGINITAGSSSTSISEWIQKRGEDIAIVDDERPTTARSLLE
jgi:hypothetical protein